MTIHLMLIFVATYEHNQVVMCCLIFSCQLHTVFSNYYKAHTYLNEYDHPPSAAAKLYSIIRNLNLFEPNTTLSPDGLQNFLKNFLPLLVTLPYPVDDTVSEISLYCCIVHKKCYLGFSRIYGLNI